MRTLENNWKAAAPLLVMVLMTLGLVSPAVGAEVTEIGFADEAIYDPAIFPPGYIHEFALYMCTEAHDCASSVLVPEPGVDFIFEPSGNWVVFDDGTARLTARAIDRSDAQKYFDIEVIFTGLTDVAPPDSPKLELEPHAYVDQGGEIDPATWSYYTGMSGTFTGGGLYEGAVIEVVRTGPAFQVGVGANNKNGNRGGSGWLECTVTSQPTTGSTIAPIEQCDINVDLSFESCPSASEANELALLPGGHVIWLPGFVNDLTFDFSGGVFTEFADGSARIDGLVRSNSDPGIGFEVEILLGGLTSEPPPGNPYLDMDPSAYVENGGPIDPATWQYYTEFSGTLTGVDWMAGASLSLHPVNSLVNGPVFQIGVGANGKNFEYGASNWFDWTVESQPDHGDSLSDGQLGELNIDLSLSCPNFRGFCLDEALRDYLGSNGDHAVAMPGVGRDFVFAEAATWFEYADGTAGFDAVIHDKNNADKIFEISVVLADRTDVAPPGSPKKQLPSSAYVPQGPADPSTWWYYPTWSATFIGQGLFEGAEVAITRRGPAFQVGVGANNKNNNFGASAWFNYQTVSQPNGNITFPNSGSGDFNIDMICAPGEAPNTPEEPEMPAGACYGDQAVSYSPGDRSDGSEVEPQRQEPSNALGEPQGGDWLNFVSLGIGGVLEIDMGSRVMNVAGDDVMIVETSFGSPSCDEFPERVTVLASQDGSSWVNLGSACQDADFDLGPLPWARYFRLIDNTDSADFETVNDGYDVDGIAGVSCQEDSADPPEDPVEVEYLRMQVNVAFGAAVQIGEVRWLDSAGRPVSVEPRRIESNLPNPAYAVDQIQSTYWTAERSIQPAELVFDVRGQGLVRPGSVRIFFLGRQLPASAFSFQLSTDGETWEELTASSAGPRGVASRGAWSRFRFEQP